MKVNAVSPSYYAGISKPGLKINNNPEPAETPKTGNSVISFKGGNPKHLFHQISELTLFGLGSGGVGTVGNDLFYNIDDFDRVVENIPLYNQDVEWVKDVDPDTGKLRGIKEDGVKLRRIPNNLPDNHPFKQYEGAAFVTNRTIGKNVAIDKFLEVPDNAKTVFILDDVATSNIDWGLEKKVPVGIYKARKDDRLKAFLRNKGWSEEMINKIDITFTYVDSTASMPKPYADGSYATATGDEIAKSLSVNWQGKPYVKEAKATAELLPALKEKMGFDPKFIMCHDGQAMPLIQYAAANNAAGKPYWQDKIVTAIGHNLNDGYMYGLSTKDAIVALAKPGEVQKIVNSKEYVDALKLNKEDEFLKTLLPKEIKDGRGQVNAVMFPIAYGEKGFVPKFTTVSYGYFKGIIENEQISPALYSRLKELSEKRIFDGIINVLMDPNTSGFTTEGLQDFYKNDCKIKLKDGTEVTLPKFLAFDKTKADDLKHVREVKRQNKLSLLKRLNNDFMGSQLFSDGKWLEEGTGFSAAVTGNTGRQFKLIGGIDPKYIQMLEKGEDVPMFVSWGRGDFQKGMDTGLEAFEKFVRKTKNTNSIYIYGGDMKNLPEVVKLTKELTQDPLFKGRILLLDGWTPGGSFAAAGDYASLCSRFAPCELTDLEAMKKGCVPIVPKVQGMDQKVFDPADAEHSKDVNGYKGKHEYYMTEADALKAASQKEQESFNKVKTTVINELKKDYKAKIGEEIPEELLEKQLKDNEKYHKALQKLRDSVISDDIAECMERAVNDRNTATAEKIWKNHVDMKTTWRENGWLSPGGKSTSQLYKEYHFDAGKAKNLQKDSALGLNLSGLHAERTGSSITYRGGGSATKKVLGIAAAAAAGLAIGYALFKPSGDKVHHSKNKNKKNEEKHLSAIG